MRQLITTLFIIAVNLNSNCQSLSIQVEIASPAHCRLYNYQSGNGEMTVYATGGVLPYSYFWEDLSNGVTSSNTTMIGRSPGQYAITVTDSIGTQVMDSITLDSINPVAIFDLISDDLTFSNDKYIGFGSADAKFIKTTDGISQPWLFDTLFFWNLDLNQTEWFPVLDDNEEISYKYSPGIHQACLIKRNFNHCADTTCTQIEIFEDFNTNGENSYSLLPNYTNQNLTLNQEGFEEGLRLRIYNSAGQLIYEGLNHEPQSSICFNQARGIYLYVVIDHKTNSVIGKHKFFY